MDIREGSLVYGKTKEEVYEVGEYIGGGAFGEVFAASDKEGRKFALKTVRTNLLDDMNLRALKNEGNLSTNIDHDNVIRVYFFHDGELYNELPPYMIMEFADGGNLEELMDSLRERKTWFSLDEINEMLLSLAAGMKAISTKLVHRDIKPNNILFKLGKPKIADFGLSKIAGEVTRSWSRTFKGINHFKYAAPEAWLQKKNTIAMDMYSMGLVFYEISTKSLPWNFKENGDEIEFWKRAHTTFVPQNPNEKNPDLEVRIAQIIIKMLSKRPEDRYGHWDEVIDRIEEQHSNEDAKVNVDKLIEEAVRSKQRYDEMIQKGEEKARIRREKLERFQYSLSEITAGARELVHTFNSESDFAELKIDTEKWGFRIYVPGRAQFPIQCKIIQTESSQEFQGRKIIAWGSVQGYDKKGFNLLLAQKSEEDLYGVWVALPIMNHASATEKRREVEPFAFETDELPYEVEKIQHSHVYTTESVPYETEMLVALMADLIRDKFP